MVYGEDRAMRPWRTAAGAGKKEPGPSGLEAVLFEDVSIRNFSCLQPGLDWTRLFMSLTAGAGTRCMSLLSSSPSQERKASVGDGVPVT